MGTEKGFTLIELVITIVIIGLISTIAFPNFSKIQSKAKETSLRNVGHSVQMALESYYLDQGTYPAGTSIHLVDLMTVLKTNGDLNQTPENPYTGQAFSATDGSGKVVYDFDEDANVYSLTGYGQGNVSQIFKFENI